MIRLEDIGELGYGGLVTGLTRWDARRVTEGKITEKDLVKKAGFWGYLVPGVGCLLANAFGWMRRWEPWTERVTHGFIYGAPGVVMNLVDIFKEAAPVGAKGGSSAGGSAAAVAEAQRLLAEARSRQLGAGAKGAGVTPGIYIEEQEILA